MQPILCIYAFLLISPSIDHISVPGAIKHNTHPLQPPFFPLSDAGERQTGRD